MRTIHARRLRRAGVAGILAVMALQGGCVVPQPSGTGRTRYLAEPTRDATYYLYLPDGYRASGRAHPLVVTFHGMKPFDSASAQVREWQSEADRYGYVVVAPVLKVSCAYGPFPLDRLDPWLLEDESNALAVIDDVERTVNVDPASVLVTSWSYGGYVAHYMLNRHPERFSCLAVKQSNFNANILDPSTVPRYVHMPIAIFGTSNDFRQNKVESQEAALWYMRNGFDVTVARFLGLGHARTPGPAAAFFARHCGARAGSAPWELAYLKLDTPMTTDDLLPVVRADRARAEARPVAPEASPAGAGALVHLEPREARRDEPPGPDPHAQSPRAPSSSRAETPASASAKKPGGQPTGPRPAANDAPETIAIQASPGISITPLIVEYRAIVPSALRSGARYKWFMNNRAISNGPVGKSVLVQPGEYELKLEVIGSDDAVYSATKTLTVLERTEPQG